MLPRCCDTPFAAPRLRGGRFFAASLLLTALIAGCTRSSEAPTATAPAEAPAYRVPGEPAAVDTDEGPVEPGTMIDARTAADGSVEPVFVSVERASWGDVQRIVAESTGAGQVVVVNVWSSTCGACLEKFPEFVTLHRELRERGVTCLTFNCDYDGVPEKPPEHYMPPVLRLLTQQQATCRNLLSTVGVLDLLDLPEELSFPTLLIYGPDGRLAQRFDAEHPGSGGDGGFRMSDVRGAVERLLSTAQN